MRHQLIKVSKVFMKKSRRGKILTTKDIKKMIKNASVDDHAKHLLSSLKVWSANITGSDGYWIENVRNLRAITEELSTRKQIETNIRARGSPSNRDLNACAWTCFHTWSAADSHWGELFKILTGDEKTLTRSDRYKLYLKHPVRVGDFLKRNF